MRIDLERFARHGGRARRQALVQGLAALTAAAFCAAPGLAPRAEGLTVSGATATKLAGNFADDTDYTDRSYATSSVGVVTSPGGPIPDAPGASLSFTTRYVALLVGDGDASSQDGITGTKTASYRIQFSVTAGAGVQYSLSIDTRLLGELTTVDDNTGKPGAGTISNVTGTYVSGGGTTGGTLNLTSNTSLSSETGGDSQFLNTSTFTVFGLTGTGGVQNFTLDFTWTMSATSDSNGANIADEAAVRLGQSPPLTTLTGTTAGNYPGDNSRVSCLGSVDLSSCDGHTVRISVNEIPAPASLSLLALGLVTGGSGVCWRRLRRR